MQNFPRPLDNNLAVEYFLGTTLALDYSKLKNIVPKIVDAEMGYVRFSDLDTMTKLQMRSEDYRNEADRWVLRKKIVNELFTLQRLDNDDKIKLGKGGALPLTKVNKKSQAYIVIGGPASGKSTIANKIADKTGSIIIDSDYAKRKLPEFKNHAYGATIVHNESSAITFKFEPTNPENMKALMELAIEQQSNIVIPRIGNNPASLIEFVQMLIKKYKYEVHLVLVYLPKREATIRAVKRFATSGRYVPIAMIFDGYGNDPTNCYFYLRGKFPNLFKSMGVLYTGEKDSYYIDNVGKSPVLDYEFKNLTLQLP